MKTGICRGFDVKGEEVARVPLKEPIIIREPYDEKRNVHRISIS